VSLTRRRFLALTGAAATAAMSRRTKALYPSTRLYPALDLYPRS
jgi:hypothetical protein